MPFGPGQITAAVKMLIGVNVAMFVLNIIVPAMTLRLGLVPAAVLHDFAIWQPVTYMFLHDTGGLGHLLINMLALWMFGTELERTWGTRFFLKYYFVCGIGAAAITILLSILPISIADAMYYSVTVGASGAIYGLLLGYGMYLSQPTDLPLFHSSDSREVLRDDRRRHRVHVVSGRSRWRCGSFRAPRRTTGRLSLSEGIAHSAA